MHRHLVHVPAMTTALDNAKHRLEMSEELFTRRLRGFCERLAPPGAGDAFDFQADLTRLMVDAMTNKGAALSFGLETYAASVFEHMALKPLAVVYEATKDKVVPR
jgi:hypothetical protein